MLLEKGPENINFPGEGTLAVTVGMGANVVNLEKRSQATLPFRARSLNTSHLKVVEG